MTDHTIGPGCDFETFEDWEAARDAVEGSHASRSDKPVLPMLAEPTWDRDAHGYPALGPYRICPHCGTALESGPETDIPVTADADEAARALGARLRRPCSVVRGEQGRSAKEPSALDLWKRGASYDEIQRQTSDCPICGERIEPDDARFEDEGVLHHWFCWWMSKPPFVAGGQGRSAQSVHDGAYALALLVAGFIIGFGVKWILGG